MDDSKKQLTRRQVLIAGAGVAGVGAAAALTGGARSVFAQHPQSSTSSDPGSSLPVDAIEDVFGVQGTVEPGGVLMIDLPRTDLHPTIFGIPVSPDIGFDTEISFQPISQGAIVKWEFCLLDKEVNPVLDSVYSKVPPPPGITPRFPPRILRHPFSENRVEVCFFSCYN